MKTTIMFSNKLIWFYVTTDADGKIVEVEEHDYYSGGIIGRPGDDQLALLLKHMAHRGATKEEIIAAERKLGLTSS